MNKYLLNLLVILAIGTPKTEASSTIPDPSEEAARREHSRRVTEANSLINRWENAETRRLREHLAQRGLPGGPTEDFDMLLDPKPLRLPAPSVSDMERDRATQERVLQYYGHQGHRR